MRAWILVLLPLGACSNDTGGVADAESDHVPRAEEANAAGCPDLATLLSPSFPKYCEQGAIGVTCRYTAFGCEPGQKPDNTCFCAFNGFACSGHLRSCLAVAANASWVTPEDRPIPSHREFLQTCGDPGNTPREDACTPSSPLGSSPECKTSLDCTGDEACQLVHAFAGSSTCRCLGAECLVDEDCGSGALCDCGVYSAEIPCGSPYRRQPCGNRCLKAHCRVDNDCPNGWCSPSPNECNSGTTHWACHDLDNDECLTDAECVLSKDGGTCRHTGEGWRCTSGPICD